MPEGTEMERLDGEVAVVEGDAGREGARATETAAQEVPRAAGTEQGGDRGWDRPPEPARGAEGDWDRTPEQAPKKPVRELTPRELGMKGEDMASRYLERNDWDVLARNWRCRFGEVDIVAREPGDEETVVLVEVKTRLCLGERQPEMPELSVDAKKRRRYRNLALAYVVDHPDVDSIRFDVIALNVVGESQARLRHLRGAFGWED